jgi:hypothetical protein
LVSSGPTVAREGFALSVVTWEQRETTGLGRSLAFDEEGDPALAPQF